MNLISLFISSILVENIVLTNFLGLNSLFDIPYQEKKVLSLGVSVAIVMIISNIINYVLYKLILIPFNIEYISTILFIIIIVLITIFLENYIKKYFPKLQELSSINLSLITTNSAIMGAVLLNITNKYLFVETLIYSLGTSLGYILILYIFSNIKVRLEDSPIPRGFKGIPIMLITLAIISLIFMRYVGL
jgi:electron transport complex protein RnfA